VPSAETVNLPVWAQALASVALISAIPLLGAAALLAETRVQRVIPHLVSFAAGALLGGATFHLIPATYQQLGIGVVPGLLLSSGFLGFFVLDRFLWAHHHDSSDGGEEPRPHPVAMLSLIGDGLHNIIDGVIIAATFMVRPELGLATAAAVALHELPQEIGDLAVLLHAGIPPRKAILLNLLSGLAAVVAAGATLLLGEIGPNHVSFLLPVAAGLFIYIAAADLVPELRHVRGGSATVSQLALMILGIGVLALGALWER